MKDGKINLHKVNGVKIAVPVAKMSLEDLDYVERMTGGGESGRAPKQGAGSQIGASVEQRKPDYDWFQFFLDCDVSVGLCERYAQAFAKESMDESVLPDVDASVLRTLGLREGDIIKVMRTIDAQFGRSGKSGKDAADGEGGLFSGPGGTLRNNTRKGRPAPTVQTADVVDPKAFSRTDGEAATESKSPSSADKSSSQPASGGFDDDAWDVKPAKQSTPALAEKPVSETPQPTQNLAGSMQDLSLLTAPLQPTPVHTTSTGSDPGSSALPVAPAQPQAPSGATPSFFTNLGAAQDQGISSTRQRPQPPFQAGTGQGTLAPPPPARPLSAPNAAQSSAFSPPPLVPQMTGSVHPSLQGHVAPPGQSLNEVDQARLREQYLRQMQGPQMAPYGAQPLPSGLVSHPTGIQGQMSQPLVTGPPSVSAPQFVTVQSQPTGFPHAGPPQQSFSSAPMASGMNSFLPPALEPQRTGVPGLPGPPAPAPFMPQQTGPPAPAPLLPQQTGPAPSVRFGVKGDTPRLAPQPTGRKANLAQASKNPPSSYVVDRSTFADMLIPAPDNPFGF